MISNLTLEKMLPVIVIILYDSCINLNDLPYHVIMTHKPNEWLLHAGKAHIGPYFSHLHVHLYRFSCFRNMYYMNTNCPVYTLGNVFPAIKASSTCELLWLAHMQPPTCTHVSSTTPAGLYQDKS